MGYLAISSSSHININKVCSFPFVSLSDVPGMEVDDQSCYETALGYYQHTWHTLVFPVLWCTDQYPLFPADGQILCKWVHCFHFSIHSDSKEQVDASQSIRLQCSFISSHIHSNILAKLLPAHHYWMPDLWQCHWAPSQYFGSFTPHWHHALLDMWLGSQGLHTEVVTLSHSTMGKSGAISMPVLPMYPIMGSEGPQSFIRARQRCDYVLFIQRRAGTTSGMPQISQVWQAITTIQVHQTVRGGLGGPGPWTIRFFCSSLLCTWHMLSHKEYTSNSYMYSASTHYNYYSISHTSYLPLPSSFIKMINQLSTMIKHNNTSITEWPFGPFHNAISHGMAEGEYRN